MPDNVKEIKDFITIEAEELRREIMFYYQEQICVPQKDKGIMFGKKLAYDKVLDFIENMEETQEENK